MRDLVKKKISNNAHRLRSLNWAKDFLGGKCVECGSVENLHFDHIDPKSVEFRIAERIGSRKEVMIPELRKCQLLCRSCHWDKTRRERGLNNSDHGTANRYNNYKCRCTSCRLAWRSYIVPKVKAYRVRKRKLV